MFDTFPLKNGMSYKVKEERHDLFGIYFVNYNQESLVTHKTSKKQAQKLAKKLQEAFVLGYEEARSLYAEDNWRI